ncbi:unnamed protein product, partial [Mesorhabditis spiculigera]
MSPGRDRDGIHWTVASTFIIGTMVGAGLVVLPHALAQSGLITGLIVLLGGALLSAYTGILLGQNWLLIEKRRTFGQQGLQDPYPQMAAIALGRNAGIFVRILLCVSQFGVTTVFLILAAKNISSLLRLAAVDLDFCIILPAISMVLLPVVMLESPKDFWQAAVCAALCTLAAIVLIFLGASWDRPTCWDVAQYDAPEMGGIFLSLGTALFAFGCHSLIVAMYVPVSVYSYLVYGNSLSDDASKSIQTEWVRHGVTILITLHVTSALVIVISPVFHSFEKLFRVPNRLGCQRIAVRSMIWIAVLFVALSIPKFGVFLDLVGGSTIALLSIVLPALFNMYLRAAHQKQKISQFGVYSLATWKDVLTHTPKVQLLLNLFCIVLGAVSGLAATYSAAQSIFLDRCRNPVLLAAIYTHPGSTNRPTNRRGCLLLWGKLVDKDAIFRRNLYKIRIKFFIHLHSFAIY